MSDSIGFLIYDSRSGSTLLASVLNAHPELFVSLEAEYPLTAMEYVRRHGRPPEGATLETMVREDRRLAEWNFDGPAVFREMASEGPAVTPEAFTRRLLETAARRDPGGAHLPKRWILKQGLLTGYLPELRRVWPDAPVVHIYRDGRAVFASKKRSVNVDSNRPMASDPVQAARRWAGIQRAVREPAAGRAPLHVRYEDLLMESDAVLSRVWRFFDVVPASLDTLDLAAYARRIPGSQKKIHTLVGSAPNPERLTAWRRDLSIGEIWRYERTAVDQLARCGYAPAIFSGAGLASLAADRIARFLDRFRSAVREKRVP
jgi:hypothetical protein